MHLRRLSGGELETQAQLGSREIYRGFLSWIQDKAPTAGLTSDLTKTVLQYFATLYQEGSGYRLWVDRKVVPKSKGQYLVDLCWTREEKDTYGIELAVESELSERDLEKILDDFYKLVDIKARRKVMVCWAGDDQQEELLKRLIDLAGSSLIQTPEEDYLCVFLVPSKGVRAFPESRGYILDSATRSFRRLNEV